MLPSKEVLLETPLHLLRNAYTSQIDTPEEEAILQEVINLKQQRTIIPQQTGTKVVPVVPNDKEIGRGTLERISPTGQVEPVLKAETKAEAKFCQFCDSKGVRHKLNCTRPKG